MAWHQTVKKAISWTYDDQVCHGVDQVCHGVIRPQWVNTLRHEQLANILQSQFIQWKSL